MRYNQTCLDIGASPLLFLTFGLRPAILQACISEGLRMNPIGPLVGRDTISPAQLGPYCIPPGSTVHLYYQYALNDPKHWKNPNGFWPERFLSSFDPTAYVPFGVGPRGCGGCASLWQSIPHVNMLLSVSFTGISILHKYLTIHVVMRRVHELTCPRTR
jgi:hypothetical protein